MDILRFLSTMEVSEWPLAGFIARVPNYVWAALISALATLGLGAFFAPRGRSLPGAQPTGATSATDCDFLIRDARIAPANDPARALLDSLPPGPSKLAALSDHLAANCPHIQQDLEALILYGTAFRRHCSRSDGTLFEVAGEPRGGAAFFSIRAASTDARALKQAQDTIEQLGAEARFLREVLDQAPILSWSTTPDGQVSWANAAYRSRFDAPSGDLPDHRLPNAFDHAHEEVPLTARDGGSRRRVAIAGAQDADLNWFEVVQSPGSDGGTLGYALDADDLVQAEGSLRRLIETLTETFAHLPIGLAVFDKNRRLGLFNPALTNLVKIDAVWLAGRPSLRDFLERLRETRQMPDQKDFASWRRKLTELEEGAREGTYEENWVLPSGKVFRVTGRPHPQGALAFLFEDISSAIRLERRYRSELELSQATLDRMSEAVVVFDASGMLVFANSAFGALWGLDPMERLQGPAIGEMTRRWKELCGPSDVWERLSAFATGGEARSSWSAAIETRDGRALNMLVAPLPDASALVVFRDRTAEGLPSAKAREAELDALALEQIQLPAEAAVCQLAALIPAAASPEAFQALSAAAQNLKDGLARSRELYGLAQGERSEAAPASPWSRLHTALAARGMSLDLAAEPDAADPALRRALWALVLAAIDLAAPGAEIAVAMEASEDAGLRRIAVRAPAGPGAAQPESVGLALARRVLERGGGTLRVLPDPDGRRIALIGDLPRGPAAAGEAAALGHAAHRA